MTLDLRFSMIFLIGAGFVNNLRAQPSNKRLAVSWSPPTDFTNAGLITGYSVRWCTHTTSSARSSNSDCKSEDVSRDSLSFQISGLEEGVTYNVSVKVNTRVANDKWSSTLASSIKFQITPLASAYTVLVNMYIV